MPLSKSRRILLKTSTLPSSATPIRSITSLIEDVYTAKSGLDFQGGFTRKERKMIRPLKLSRGAGKRFHPCSSNRPGMPFAENGQWPGTTRQASQRRTPYPASPDSSPALAAN